MTWVLAVFSVIFVMSISWPLAGEKAGPAYVQTSNFQI